MHPARSKHRSQGHTVTESRFSLRRSLHAKCYRTATQVTPQLPTGGDVSLYSRRRRRRCSWDAGSGTEPRLAVGPNQCLKKIRLRSQKTASIVRALKMCVQAPELGAFFPGLARLSCRNKSTFPQAKHRPLAIRNVISGVLSGSEYPAITIPTSIPSSMNTTVDFLI
jgi:hypothetical protein